jgi:hypothetical protein
LQRVAKKINTMVVVVVRSNGGGCEVRQWWCCRIWPYWWVERERLHWREGSEDWGRRTMWYLPKYPYF